MTPKTRPGNPAFIPLKAEYYWQFLRGEKTEEYRMLGRGWNENAMYAGRPVVLSLGYARAHRTDGMITGVRILESGEGIPGWRECYGDRPGRVIAIAISLKA